MILFYIYICLSLIVGVFTISVWKSKESIILNTEVGDWEYFDFSLSYNLLNYIFLPSVLLCIAYKILCRIINFIVWR